MAAQSVICPSESVLSDFGLGKLDAATADSVSQHIETCPDCRQRVASLSGDSFVGRLRQAGGAAQASAQRQRTYVPGESLANAANSTDGSSINEDGRPRPSRSSNDAERRDGLGSPSSVSAPPELANHPDYELIKELGQGGMGTVYLARNRMMDRPEVLKVISKSLLDRPGALERFQQEIRSAAKLAHTNIVTAYSVLKPGELLVFAMEYVHGQDLSEVVKQRGPLPVANAAFYIHQVANGLQHAFEKGMVHRDIKPNNLMLAVEGKKHVVKILDFGLAKATSEKGAETGLTKSGQMLGTPDYVAPEQTLDAHKADIRADIYSLGCTLYFLLAGGPPFQETSLYEILEAHHKRDPKPLNLVRPDVPVELAAVVAKMMAKDPTKRYQTPVEVAKALVPFFKPGQTAAAPAAPTTTQPQTTTETENGHSATTPPSPMVTPQPVTPFPAPIELATAQATPCAAEPADLLSVSVDTARTAAHRGILPSSPPRRGGRNAWIAAGGAATVLLATIVFFLPTKDGVIRVQINDDQVAIAIQGSDIVLKKADNGRDVKLSPGEKTLVVERGDFKFETDKLILKKGETLTVDVTLSSGELEVREGDNVIGRHQVTDRSVASSVTSTAADGGKQIGPANLSDPPRVSPPANLGTAQRFACEIPRRDQGLWSIEGDELVQNSSKPGGAHIFFGDPNWTDYDFSFEAKPVEGHYLRSYFRYRDEPNNLAYVIGAHANGWQIVDIVDRGKFGKRLTQGRLKLTSGNWYRVQVRVRGQQGICFLDGHQVLQEFAIERHAAGRVGFCTGYGGDGAAYRFRNIVVKDAHGNVLLQGLPDLDHVSDPGRSSLAKTQSNDGTTNKQGNVAKSDSEGSSAPQVAQPTAGSSKRFAFEIPDPGQARWSIDGDDLVQSAMKGGKSIVFGDPAWEDFDFSVDAQRTAGSDLCAIWFGYQDDRNLSNFELGGYANTRLAVHRFADGKGRQLTACDGSVTTGKWYRLKLSLRGSTGQCFVDDQPVLNFQTERRPRGRLGLRTWNSAYRFRNIVVKAPDGAVLLEGLPDLSGGADRGSAPAVSAPSATAPATPQPPPVSALASDPPRDRRSLADLAKDQAAAPAEAGYKLSATEAFALKEHTGAVTRVAFHPTLSLLASSGKDGQVLLWDLDKQTLMRQVEKFKQEVWTVKFSPDGNVLAYANRHWGGSQVSLRNVSTAAEIKRIKDFKRGGGAVGAVAFSPDGAFFATGQDDGAVRLWETSAFQELLPVSAGDRVNSLVFGPITYDRKRKPIKYVLAAACDDESFKMFDLTYVKDKSGERWTFAPGEVAFAKQGRALCARFSPDGKVLAAGQFKGAISFLDPATGQPAQKDIRVSGANIDWIAFHPTRPWIVAAHSQDHLARIWNYQTGALLCELSGHTGGVFCAEFSRDGRRVATASDDFSVNLWDLSGADVPPAIKASKKVKRAAPTVGE